MKDALRRSHRKVREKYSSSFEAGDNNMAIPVWKMTRLQYAVNKILPYFEQLPKCASPVYEQMEQAALHWARIACPKSAIHYVIRSMPDRSRGYHHLLYLEWWALEVALNIKQLMFIPSEQDWRKEYGFLRECAADWYPAQYNMRKEIHWAPLLVPELVNRVLAANRLQTYTELNKIPMDVKRWIADHIKV